MYKLFCSGFSKEPDCVLLQRDNILLTIPFNPDNTDYQAYLKWLEEGNTPEPAEETI